MPFTKGHVNVHEHDIGLGVGNVLQDLAAVVEGTDAFHQPHAVDEHREPIAPLEIVIKNGNPSFHHVNLQRIAGFVYR